MRLPTSQLCPSAVFFTPNIYPLSVGLSLICVHSGPPPLPFLLANFLTKYTELLYVHSYFSRKPKISSFRYFSVWEIWLKWLILHFKIHTQPSVFARRQQRQQHTNQRGKGVARYLSLETWHFLPFSAQKHFGATFIKGLMNETLAGTLNDGICCATWTTRGRLSI